MNDPAAALIPASNLPALQTHETAASAAAAQVKALVEARYTVALARPRDLDGVREAILKECRRPSFAEVARYSKPQGKKKNENTGVWEDNFAEGPSIRFAEAAIRCMKNIVIDETTTYDDDDKRLIQVSVSDLESNVSYTGSITVVKTVERKKTKPGDDILRKRTNSYGDPVYIIRASDDEIQNKKNALLSKAIRTLGLRHIPGDIIDEAMEMVISTQKEKDAKDPDAARKKILDAFAALNVPVADLKKYVGHELSTLSPSELTQLRALHAAIKDGESSWKSAMSERFPDDAEKASRFSDDKKAATGEAKP